jgi:plasmid stability protein
MSNSTEQEARQILSPEAIALLVNNLPDYIKAALLKKSAELECSLEATIAQGNLQLSR